jgi:hypothetical protein
MQLVKNLYGIKQAARNWYLLFSETLTLEHHGFKASKIDPCLFIRNDCIILGRNQTTIDKLKSTLTEVDTEVDGFLHWTEATLNDFVGVCMNMHTTATGN